MYSLFSCLHTTWLSQVAECCVTSTTELTLSSLCSSYFVFLLLYELSQWLLINIVNFCFCSLIRNEENVKIGNNVAKKNPDSVKGRTRWLNEIISAAMITMSHIHKHLTSGLFSSSSSWSSVTTTTSSSSFTTTRSLFFLSVIDVAKSYVYVHLVFLKSIIKIIKKS